MELGAMIMIVALVMTQAHALLHMNVDLELSIVLNHVPDAVMDSPSWLPRIGEDLFSEQLFIHLITSMVTYYVEGVILL